MENITATMDITSEKEMQISRRENYYVIPAGTVLMVRNICYIGIVPVLVCIGVVLNSLCFALFCRLKSKSSTVVMLLALTLSDMLIILIAAVNSIFQASKSYGVPLTTEQQRLAVPYFAAYINGIPGRIGNLLTFLISIERLFCVLKPLKVRQYSTKRNAFIAVTMAFISTVLLCLPNLFLYRTDRVYSNTTGHYEVILKSTSYGQNKELTNAVYVTLEILFRYIPVLGVTVCSVTTGIVVVVTSRRRKNITQGSVRSRSSSKESQVTRTLLVITFTFVAFQLPGTILRMIIFVDPDMTPFRYKNNIYEAAFPMTYLLTLLNSVVNFVIYYTTSGTYKANIKTMFRCNDAIGNARAGSTSVHVENRTNISIVSK